MKPNILITGAAGFLGSFLCEELVNHGYLVVGVDNFFRGRPDNIKQLLTQKNFHFVEMDLSEIANREPLKNYILSHHIELILHLSAINGTQYFYDRPLFVLDQNLKMTQNLLAAIENTEVNYLVYTSSSEVYGDPLIIPTPETHPILLQSFADRDSYAASKAMGEFYVRLQAQQSHIRCLILRVFNLYGARMVGTRYGQVIAEFINRIINEKQFTMIGDGTNTRSFCYIQDAVSAMRQLIELQASGIINIGNDDEISIITLAKKIHQLENKSFEPVFLPERPYDHKRRQPDISALKKLLPKLNFTDLTTGLEKVIAFFKGSKI